MAQPTRYTRRYSATSWAIGHPTVPQPGSSLDAEFNAIRTTLDEALDNLALIQADDGEVANQTIGIDQLKPELILGIEAPTVWATDTAYAVNNTVTYNNSIYRCAVAHTSGTFATDLAAVKWILLANFVGGLGAVESVNGATGDVVLDADDIDDTSTANKFATAAQLSKLDAIESGATADQTGAEIKALYEAESDTNAFTDAEKTKLAAIEAGADVTDTANVQAAGALMDSELASEASVKAINQGLATSNSPAFAGLTTTGSIFSTGYTTRTGESGSYGSNRFNINWTGSAADLWIDTTNAGQITLTSDYRIKRDVETQTEPGIDRIKRLRPVTYKHRTYRNWSVESDDLHEGFIAHELAEVIPDAVRGEKDAEDQVQSLKLDALVSVLVKAVQELSHRLDALEGA